MDEVPSVLACDVGNTRVRMAVVNGEDISDLQSLRVGDLASLGGELRELWTPLCEGSKIVACSVNPSALKALEAAAAESTKQDVLVIGRDLPPPIDTDLDEPQSVGTDRLCCAAAAFDRLGVSCVVADFGTAATIDCVNDKGVFLGGAIMPGLSMGAQSLHDSTAQLPLVELGKIESVFGRNTSQAIAAGLIRGAHGALRELVEAYATELGHWPVVIATGGDAELICGAAGEAGLVQAIVPELALRGAAMAFYRNLLK